MALIKNPLSGGGGGGDINILNGVIEQYRSSTENIDANTFVEFINDWQSVRGEGDKQVSDTAGSAYQCISATKINSEKVLLAHVIDGSSKYAYVCIVSIIDGEILHGTETLVSSVLAAGSGISTTLIEDNKVFVGWLKRSSDFRAYPNGAIASISGNTVTIGTSFELADSSSESGSIATTLVSGNVFVLFGKSGDSSTQGIYGVVATVSGDSITTGAKAFLTGYLPGNGRGTGIVTYDTNKVLYAVLRSGSYSVGAFAVRTASISGTTITEGSGAAIESSTSSYGSYNSLCMVNSSTALIAYKDSYRSATYARLIYLSGTTATLGTSYGIGIRGNGVVNPQNTVLVDNNKVLLCLTSENFGSITGYIISIDTGNDSITYTGPYPLGIGNVPTAAVKLDEETLFIPHGYGSVNTTWFLAAGLAIADGVPVSVKTATDSKRICGLTTQSITPSVPGKVWVLNTNESE